MSRFNVIAEGLAFPEGPVELPEGSVLVTEIGAGRLTRITVDGAVSVVANTGGGPNGAALGLDGRLYVCNNGGFAWERSSGAWRPVGRAPDNEGGRIERVDLTTGRVERIYTHCMGIALAAPNDLVIDAHGGFFFTDHGHRAGRSMDLGAVFYARCDGSAITQVAFPLIGPNGIGLSPGGTILYVAETSSGRLWSWKVTRPGCLAAQTDWPSPTGGNLVCGLPGFQRYDSLAVEACGNIAIATLRFGGIVVVSSAGRLVERIELPDPYTTNICFGGEQRDTAFITLSGSGRIVRMPWSRPGLKLIV